MTEKEYEKLLKRIKLDINIYSDEEYEELLERIKFDLYKEFIDPETATYGIKYAEDKQGVSDIIYEGILSEKQMLQDELGRLCTIQNKFIDNEEYEKAEIMKRKIRALQNKIDKL
tara:strand:+ start:41 stop:385 length:345 start_codon:yes stop_codon:yes gene_type:complete